MFYDMHVHSVFSADGISTLEEYAALFGGEKPGVIGFAEHIDFLPECGSYEYMDPRKYIDAVRSLRVKGFDFYAGAEIDYVYQVEADIAVHLKQYDYDYTICSVHMIDGVPISDRNFPPTDADSDFLSRVAEAYYEELYKGIKAGLFDVVGHVGVFTRYLSGELRDDGRLRNLIRETELEIAQLCAKSGIIVEVNTSGLFSPSACQLPGNEFLKNYHDFGGRLVCIGSDAHRTADVARGFETAARALIAAGFEYITLPWDREKRIRL